MDNLLLLYLLKVSAGTTLIYAGYLLFFRTDTFYLRNRIFLILALILPTLFPVFKIPVMSERAVSIETGGVIGNSVFPQVAVQSSMAGTTYYRSPDITGVIFWVYIAIMSLLLLRAIISLIRTYTIIRKGTLKSASFPKVVISEEHLPPFSFFPYVVIPAEDINSGNYSDIFEHESAHIKQGHTFDLLLSEIFIAFQWFNPIMWLIKRSIILNHEYLADQVSLETGRNLKEYQYRLLNFQSGLRHVSLAHNFNSSIKNRIIMINKKPTSRLATLKNILILPIVALVGFAFATPEYHYVSLSSPVPELKIYQSQAIIQKEVKGIVLNEEGKPLSGVDIGTTGPIGYAKGLTTGTDGRFTFNNLLEDTYLSFSCRGYKRLSVKAIFTGEMTIKMEKDPENKENIRPIPRLVVIDDVITDQNFNEFMAKRQDEIAKITPLYGKVATDKYGEKGKDGVMEIMTMKRAAELGIKIPFRRRKAEDFPTFQGGGYNTFRNWVIGKVAYPQEATSKGIEGWARVSYTVEHDGSLSNIRYSGSIDPILGDAMIKAVKESPKWEPAKNPAATEPFASEVVLKFMLPDKVTDEDVFVVVEKMPLFPGGDIEMMKFIKEHLQYPEAAIRDSIQGRVILRFIVNAAGRVEDVSVLKSVHPLLDAEAVRVLGSLPEWVPGMQGGKPVNVYYSVPVTFALK